MTVSRSSLRTVVLVLVCLVVVTASPAKQTWMRALRVEALPASTFLSAPATAPSKGKFLVATPRIRDPRFAQTVVLLVMHDQRGTIGLVVNRRTKVTLSTVFSPMEKHKDHSGFLFMGGPLEAHGVSLLLRLESQRNEAFRVLDGVLFSTSAALLKQMIAKKRVDTRFRVFAGHAGWAPGQLDWELKRGDWYVLDARAEDVFHEPPSEIWPELIRRAEAKWVGLPGTRLSRSRILSAHFGVGS